MFLQYLVFAVFAVVGLAWSVFWTSVMTRRAAAQVLRDSTKNERIVLFWWRFLAQLTALVGFVALMAAGITPGWASGAMLLCLLACIAFVRPIRAFTIVWFRGVFEPWDGR